MAAPEQNTWLFIAASRVKKILRYFATHQRAQMFFVKLAGQQPSNVTFSYEKKANISFEKSPLLGPLIIEASS